MKQLIIATVFVFICLFNSKSQVIEYNNGRYYSDDKPFTGTFTEYYPNGTKKAEIHIKDGFEDGVTFIFHENGNIKEQRQYKQGQKDGVWLTYNEDKVLMAQASYKSDKKDGC